MTDDGWEAIGEMAQIIALRFEEFELEIKKLKFKIEQLEKQNDQQRSTPNP